MKVLITADKEMDPIRTYGTTFDNIIYRPELEKSDGSSLLDVLIHHRISAVISGDPVSDATVATWSNRLNSPVFACDLADVAKGRSVIKDPAKGSSRHDPDVETALRACEKWSTSNLPRLETNRSAGNKVLLVGAGVSNLVTALYLAEADFEITIVERSAAPGSARWQQYGCTHGGDDARMFSLSEMDSYTASDPSGTPTYFRRTIQDGGWLALDRPLDEAEAKWVKEFESIPAWLTQNYNEDIFTLTAEAQSEWDHLRVTCPHLFDGVLLRDGVIRIYSDADQLDQSIRRHRRIGSLIECLPAEKLATIYPALAQAVQNGTIVGGMRAVGFTLNIHKFAARLIDHLEERNVTFRWSTHIDAIRREQGRVVGIIGGAELQRGAHMVVAAGAYGERLLAGSACENKVHGVVGGWLRLADDGCGFENSLKIARKGHVTEDANVTVATDEDGRRILIIGSGYGYVGRDPYSASEAELRAMADGISDTAMRVFPGHALARHSDYKPKISDFRRCVRPWTATSLGLFHAEVMDNNGLLITTGGHNTGGFSQSPVIATAVLSSLQGQVHIMQKLYNPARLSLFTDTSSSLASSA